MATTFKAWLENVYLDDVNQKHLNESDLIQAISILKKCNKDSFWVYRELSDSSLDQHTRRLFNLYQSYSHIEESTKRFAEDIATHKVCDLDYGFSLWRCVNGGGVKYSMIRDIAGREIKSTVRAKESGMINSFNKQMHLYIQK